MKRTWIVIATVAAVTGSLAVGGIALAQTTDADQPDAPLVVTEVVEVPEDVDDGRSADAAPGPLTDAPTVIGDLDDGRPAGARPGAIDTSPPPAAADLYDGR